MDTQYKNVLDFSFKTEDNISDGKMRFEGYLSVFGNVDSYGEVVEKGACVGSIKSIEACGRYLPILENHGGWKANASDVTPIGYFESLKEDNVGLYVKGVLYSTVRGKDIYILLKESPRGQMGMSIGYRVIKSRNATREEYERSGVELYLEEIELLEGSIVTFPANTEARVEDVKSEIMQLRSFEKSLKEEGFNAREAKTIVSILKKCGMNKNQYIKEDSESVKEINEIEAMETIQAFCKDAEQNSVQQIIEEALNNIKKM